MGPSLVWGGDRFFPCPVCMQGLQVKQTKKRKPYVVCDPCGVQLFVRNETGIRRFEALVADSEQRNVWARLEELQRRYKKTCPECGKRFWITPELAKTSWFDGKFVGYHCPESGCDGVAKEEDEEETE